MTDTRERARALCSCLGLTRLTEESEWIVDNVTADGITAFAESEAALARKQEREAIMDAFMRLYSFEGQKPLKALQQAIHERNLAETGGTK